MTTTYYITQHVSTYVETEDGYKAVEALTYYKADCYQDFQRIVGTIAQYSDGTVKFSVRKEVHEDD